MEGTERNHGGRDELWLTLAAQRLELKAQWGLTRKPSTPKAYPSYSIISSTNLLRLTLLESLRSLYSTLLRWLLILGDLKTYSLTLQFDQYRSRTVEKKKHTHTMTCRAFFVLPIIYASRRLDIGFQSTSPVPEACLLYSKELSISGCGHWCQEYMSPAKTMIRMLIEH